MYSLAATTSHTAKLNNLFFDVRPHIPELFFIRNGMFEMTLVSNVFRRAVLSRVVSRFMCRDSCHVTHHVGGVA